MSLKLVTYNKKVMEPQMPILPESDSVLLHLERVLEDDTMGLRFNCTFILDIDAQKLAKDGASFKPVTCNQILDFSDRTDTQSDIGRKFWRILEGGNQMPDPKSIPTAQELLEFLQQSNPFCLRIVHKTAKDGRIFANIYGIRN